MGPGAFVWSREKEEEEGGKRDGEEKKSEEGGKPAEGKERTRIGSAGVSEK